MSDLVSTDGQALIDRIRDRLDGVRGNGTKFEARCPAHDDNRASLSVSLGKDGVLMHCHAQCDTADILDKIGLTMKDLFPPKTAVRKERGPISDYYDYTDENGKLIYQVVRYESKDFIQRRPDGNGGWIWKMDGVKRTIYHLPAVISAVENKETVFVVEGEKDVHTVESMGLTATTNSGGADKWLASHAEHFTDAIVAIIPDNDDAGNKHAVSVAASLYGIASSIKIVHLPYLGKKQDVTDWVSAGRDKVYLLRCVSATAEWKPPTPDEVREGEEKRLYTRSDMGNAERFVRDHSDDVRYCHSTASWYVWNGRQWMMDCVGLARCKARETVRSIYAEAANNNKYLERTKLLEWAKMSEGSSRISAMLLEAQSMPPIPIEMNAFDTDANLLNVQNGTIDLTTGKLQPHRKDDMITKMAPTMFVENAHSDMLVKFLNTALPDKNIRDFLPRAMGYTLTGSCDEECLFMVYGPTASGKSTMMESFLSALGPYGSMLDFSVLLKAKSDPDGRGANPEISKLPGIRLASSIEVDEGRAIAEGLVKSMTGGDTISARGLYEKRNTEFKPQFTLWLVANDAPNMKSTDDALWRRIIVIPFDHTVPVDERDPAVKRTLRDTDEGRSAILWMAVQGCLEYKRAGLQIPESISTATADMRVEMDPLHDFFVEWCQFGPTFQTPASQLRDTYLNFCESNKSRPINTKRVAASLKAKGCENISTGSQRIWLNVGIVEGGGGTTEPLPDWRSVPDNYEPGDEG
jgi:putative DNA primase/helicase